MSHAGAGNSSQADANEDPSKQTTISRLSDEVVNRIAAGEVIHRPVSAVKEMLENSIDAGSTSIKVTANSGGLKQLSIQDNGKGIRYADLAVVCERFYTSKLKEFEDLEQIGTYGFRGEALASISHVSRVTITSKTAEQPVAYRATYGDGKIVPPGPGKKAAPRPMAGTVGTTIAVDDLFFNVPARKRALRNAADEYARILDVVSKYAIHKGLTEEEKQKNLEAQQLQQQQQQQKAVYRGVGFVCRKSASSTPDLHTREVDSKLDNIRTVYGSFVAQEVVPIQEECKGDLPRLTTVDSQDDADDTFPVDAINDGEESSNEPCWSYSGYVSNANYNKKKSTYIFFINHRLVQCSSLKRAIEGVYNEYLPKGTYPFVYLSIELPPQRIDVNVHPTKREVHFLDEDLVVGRIVQGIRDKLANANSSRVFYTQQTLHVASSQSSQINCEDGDAPGSSKMSVGMQRAQSQISAGNEDANSDARSMRGQSNEDVPVSNIAVNENDAERNNNVPTSLAQEDCVNDDDEDFEENSKRNNNDPLSTPRKSMLKRRLSDTASQVSGVSRMTSASQMQKKPAYRPEKLVRTDHRAKGLDAFLSQGGSSQKKIVTTTSRRSLNGIDPPTFALAAASTDSIDTPPEPNSRIRPSYKFDDNMTEEALTLASVRGLVNEFEGRKHDAMTKMLKTLVFVGWVDENLCLVQVNTGLYILDIAQLTQELFYQQVLRDFGQFERIVLDQPVNLEEALRIALQARHKRHLSSRANGMESVGKSPDPSHLANFLVERASMLEEYFRIHIDAESKTLRSLPEVLPGHVPRAVSLPVFLLRIVESVEWYDERGCFATLAEEIALYYSDIGPLSEDQRRTFNESDAWRHDRTDRRYIFKNIIMPHMKKLMPSEDHARPEAGVFRKVAALEKLYKIFERC